MDDRRPGEGRYAQLEREQRWLLEAVPPGAHDPVEIVDRYVRGTRLRLRHVLPGMYKLTQKVRVGGGGPERVKLTNIYVDAAEFEVLLALPADELRKTRRSFEHGGRRFAIDEFDGRHRGLVLAEVELTADEPRLALPVFAVADVTDDDRYAGGSLARSGPVA